MATRINGMRRPSLCLLRSLSCAIIGSVIASTNRPLAVMMDIKLNTPKMATWLINIGNPLVLGGIYKYTSITLMRLIIMLQPIMPKAYSICLLRGSARCCIKRMYDLGSRIWISSMALTTINCCNKKALNNYSRLSVK